MKAPTVSNAKFEEICRRIETHILNTPLKRYINFPQIAVLKDKYGKSSSTTDKEQGLNNVRDFWYKSRAGEMGIAVGAVNSQRNQRRIIQSLYDLAASIAFRTGMTKTEKEIARRTGDTSYSRVKRKATFKGGPYVKVY